MCPKHGFGHTYKVSACNPHKKYDFCNTHISREYFGELAKHKWNTPLGWVKYIQCDAVDTCMWSVFLKILTTETFWLACVGELCPHNGHPIACLCGWAMSSQWTPHSLPVRVSSVVSFVSTNSDLGNAWMCHCSSVWNITFYWTRFLCHPTVLKSVFAFWVKSVFDPNVVCP